MVDFEDTQAVIELIKKLEEHKLGDKDKLQAIKTSIASQKALFADDRQYLEDLESQITTNNHKDKKTPADSTLTQKHKPKTEHKKTSFSSYGTYEIQQSLELDFRNNNKIQITKSSENDTYQYLRKTKAGPDRQEEEIQRTLLSSKGESLSISIAPVLALNIPAKRTDLMMLEFENPLYLKENAQAKIHTMVPTEVAIFTKGSAHTKPAKPQEQNHSLKRKISKKDKQQSENSTADAIIYPSEQPTDVFSCNAAYSRFGLYGSPDNGRLCKYVKAQVVNYNCNPEPCMAKMDISLKNQTNSGIYLDEIVFYATNHNLYYLSDDVIADPLDVNVKHDVSKLVCELAAHDISQDMTSQGWSKSPSIYSKTDTKFVMDKGAA